MFAVVAATLGAASFLVFGRVDIHPASARLAAAGLVIYAGVVVAGLGVARARWAQRSGWLVAAVAGGVVAAGRPIDAWWWIVLVLAGTAALSLQLRPVTEWIATVDRRVPIPTAAVVLMLMLVAVPFVVGVIHLDSLPPTALAAALVTLALGWAYSQAHVWALWILRFGLPVLGLGWVWGARWWGALAGGLLGLVALATAWRAGALLAAQPLEPRKVVARPILAELAPEDVRRVARVDERGKPT